MWGPWMLLAQAAPENSGWLNLLLGSGGLLAGLVVAVRAYDSGRVVTRVQFETTVRELKTAHAAHVRALEERAAEDRGERARWESLAMEAWRVNRGRSHDGEPRPLGGDAPRRVG